MGPTIHRGHWTDNLTHQKMGFTNTGVGRPIYKLEFKQQRWYSIDNFTGNQRFYYLSIYLSIYIYICLDRRKDTHNCPFARFLPLGRISCKWAGNGYFLTIVVNFGFRTFSADITLLCVKMCRFFWAEIPGKTAEIPGKREDIPGQIHHDPKMKTWSGKFFSWTGNFYFEIDKSTENGQKSNQNLPWTEICNQWRSRYIYIYRYLPIDAPWKQFLMGSRMVLGPAAPRSQDAQSGRKFVLDTEDQRPYLTGSLRFNPMFHGDFWHQEKSLIFHGDEDFHGTWSDIINASPTWEILRQFHGGSWDSCDLVPSIQVAVFMKISAGEIQAVAIMVLSTMAGCSGKKTSGDGGDRKSFIILAIYKKVWLDMLDITLCNMIYTHIRSFLANGRIYFKMFLPSWL